VHILFNLICERKKYDDFLFYFILDDDKKYILRENFGDNLFVRLYCYWDNNNQSINKKSNFTLHSSLSLSETEKCLHVVKFAVRF
jgi:hypothetical protein